ncbi:MAG: glycosyltransferase family A protein [Clostridiales bacterium]|nr:glycosyltransferase family A protein [Clostridiales bacterium]
MELHTFVICAYRESQYLEECIQSLLNQSTKSRILIATSTPNDYIDELSRRYHLEVCLNAQGECIADDWNFAYEQADSKYVTLAHQDDVYEPDYVKTMLEQLEKARNPLMFFSNYGEIREGNKIQSNLLLRIKRILLVPIYFSKLRGCKRIKRGILAFGNPICCPSVTLVKENMPYPVFENHFKSNLDWEAWEKAAGRDGSFEFSRKILMYHRIHDGSETTALISDKGRNKEDYEMLCKFWTPRIAQIYHRIYSKGENSNKL